MSTHQWLLDHGLMPRPRMSSYVQKTFEIALIEAGKATREALVERERRSTAESELRGKVRDIEAAMEEAEKCKRLANDERVLRESAAAKYRQQSVALEDMATTRARASQQLQEERTAHELTRQELKRRNETAGLLSDEIDMLRRQLLEQRELRRQAEFEMERKGQALETALSERDEWRQLATREAELRQAAESDAKQGREATARALQTAGWAQTQADEDRRRFADAEEGAKLDFDALVAAEAKARRDLAGACKEATELKALREVNEADLKAKLEASRAKVITMETERLESLEERSLLKATQEQLRYEADAALAAAAEARRQLTEELATWRAATEAEMAEHLHARAASDSEAADLKRQLAEMRKEVESVRCGAAAAAEEYARTSKKAETERKEMSERLQFALGEASAAKRTADDCRSAAARDVVAARLDAMEEAAAQLRDISTNQAVADLYAKQASALAESPSPATGGLGAGRLQVSMGRIESSLAEAKMKRQLEAERYVAAATQQSATSSPALSQSLALSHTLQAKAFSSPFRTPSAALGRASRHSTTSPF